jgi:hypothetical protein
MPVCSYRPDRPCQYRRKCYLEHPIFPSLEKKYIPILDTRVYVRRGGVVKTV